MRILRPFQKAQIDPHPTMVQELWSLKVGGGVCFGQIELSGYIWTLSPLPNKNLGNLEYQNPR
jgi:hypothetical protein